MYKTVLNTKAIYYTVINTLEGRGRAEGRMLVRGVEAMGKEWRGDLHKLEIGIEAGVGLSHKKDI